MKRIVLSVAVAALLIFSVAQAKAQPIACGKKPCVKAPCGKKAPCVTKAPCGKTFGCGKKATMTKAPCGKKTCCKKPVCGKRCPLGNCRR